MPNSETSSDTFPVLLELPGRLLDYRIITALIVGDVGALNILKDALRISKQLYIDNILFALGPTTPASLSMPRGSRILWATFTDGALLQSSPRLTIVQPNHLTDLSLNLERLSKTRTGRVPMIIGDFLDNVLSVSTDQAGLYAFLCKLFTRIRMNGQTAFLVATSAMHEPKKTAVLRRFADVVIEYRTAQDVGNRRVEARILDHDHTHYGIWDSSDNPDGEHESEPLYKEEDTSVGRQKPAL